MDTPLKFTTVFIPDASGGAYTGYIAEMPAVVSQGETLEEAGINLFRMLPDYIALQNKMKEEG